MAEKNSRLSANDYAGKSNELELEMRRIRGILDCHAHAKELGVATDDNPLIQKTLRDLENVVERFKELDKKYWGLDA